VSPRAAGEADKLGNKYEAAWAIRHALYCILNEGRSLTCEEIDPALSRGSEFTYTTDIAVEAHQLKRQRGNSNYWSIKALAGLGIFESAAAHARAGREYHFVSQVPCGPLKELSERARKSADLTAFTQQWLTEELRSAFDGLSAAEVLGSPEAAWDTLRGMWFEVQDENEVVRVNAVLAQLCLEGSTGHLAALALGDILLESLGRRLTRRGLLEALGHHGIATLGAGARQSASSQLSAVTGGWRGTIQRELLQPPIERTEAAQLVEVLSDTRLALVVGTAGGGKSAVLESAVASLEASGTEVLALRLDRLEAFASTVGLGQQLGFEVSPAAALALAADGGDACLVVDQLDAVSLASGRMPESFDTVMDLVDEALSVPGLRVVLACRDFDVENDHRIRALAARPQMRKVAVGALSDEAVDAAAARMGLNPARLTVSQRMLLRTPLHLVLLSTIASQEDALAFQSRGSLYEAFWERKRQAVSQRRSGVRFNAVVARVANAASDRQTLSVPVELLDEDDLIEDANVLVSEHVLARDGDRIAFFHETFFDYAFARQWVSRSESLVEFLSRDEQELFRRAQVRQILQHLYGREPERFRNDMHAVLTSPAIRFHIKEAAIAVLADLSSPTSDDANLVLGVAAVDPRVGDALWLRLRRPQWFLRFHEEGSISGWLDGADQTSKGRAVDFMTSAVKQHGATVAELLRARQTAPEYLDWLRWLTRVADLHNSRRLFDLLLNAVRQGGFDAAEQELWLDAYGLGETQPLWAIELLQARLIDHFQPLALTDDGKVAALCLSEHGATELVREASAAEPLAFVQTIVPYLLDVMSATSRQTSDGAPLRDTHFSVRFPETDAHERDLDDALLTATSRALETLARTAPDDVLPLLLTLAKDPHEAAQLLLYGALAVVPREVAISVV
jgi:hypothetical protein